MQALVLEDHPQLVERPPPSADGEVPTPLISDRFPLSDGVRALERAAERDAVKVLIEASSGSGR